MKLEEEIDDIINQCWLSEVTLVQTSEDLKIDLEVKERFDVMMSEETGRTLFS
jgi:hypothetical protein